VIESCEQRARNMLERMSSARNWDDPQRLTAADVCELANVLAESERLREACSLFAKYGLPPHDASGQAEWRRAITLSRVAKEVTLSSEECELMGHVGLWYPAGSDVAEPGGGGE
jgi:hypothetical protein